MGTGRCAYLGAVILVVNVALCDAKLRAAVRRKIKHRLCNPTYFALSTHQTMVVE